MRNGIYSLLFSSSFGFSGAGSIELRNGYLRGGDDEYLYLGTYSAEGDSIRAEVCIRHFQGATDSIFGELETFTLEMVGRQAGLTFFATGIVREAHGLSMTVQGDLIEGLGEDLERVPHDAEYSRLSKLIQRTPHLAELHNFPQLVRVDIAACLNKLRKVGEKLAFRALGTLGAAPQAPNFNRAIEALKANRVLSDKAIACLHTIRVIGNLASHPSAETLTSDDVRLGSFALVSVIEEMLDRAMI